MVQHIWHFIVNSSMNLLSVQYVPCLYNMLQRIDFRNSNINFLPTSCNLVWLLQLRFIYFILHWEGTCHIFLWNKNNSVCGQCSRVEERGRKAIVWQMIGILLWSFLYTVISRTGFLKTKPEQILWWRIPEELMVAECLSHCVGVTWTVN